MFNECECFRKNEKKEKKSNSSQILQFQKIMHDNKIPFPAMDKTKFTFIDLFAGIGGMRIAFQNLGGKCVFSSEIDEQAQKPMRLILEMFLMEILLK